MIREAMPRFQTKRLLTEGQVVVRQLPDSMANVILRSLLLSDAEAILVTDLEHKSLACNEWFGALFGVPCEQVVKLEPEALRRKVYPRLRDAKSWKAKLDEVYASPRSSFEDEMELLGDPPVHLLRATSPMLDAQGEAVGRIWRFRDVSAVRRRERIRDFLLDVATFRESDPATVCRMVVQRLAAFYEATAILSIRKGDVMVFREMSGMPLPYSFFRSNQLKDSFCKSALEAVRPLIIQDARLHPELRKLSPARLGFKRYLGTPVFDQHGDSIGTLCMMDGRTEQALGPDDQQLLSMLALRIGIELDRERLYAERTADQRELVQRQKDELTETARVLDAMNSAFQLLNEAVETDALVARQVQSLSGLLGYEAVALWLVGPSGLESAWRMGLGDKQPLEIEGGTPLKALRSRPKDKTRIAWKEETSGPVADAIGSPHALYAWLKVGESHTAFLAFGTSTPEARSDRRRLEHLDALVDQVSLLLTAQMLQRSLVEAHDDLREANARLVQTEKLSVVGTLAAGIAHDIRNIVSSLSLECSLGEADPQTALANVKVQLDRFAVLAHRLLSYAKPRLVAREEVVISEALRRVIALTGAQARVAGVRVNLEIGEEVVVLADSSQTEHLFVNLVLNALQSMQPRGGDVMLSVAARNGRATIEVRDEGPGFGRDQIQHLFEPFQSTRADGFGLGLFSCKRIAIEHGWLLEAESRPNTGATFRVVMPLEEGAFGTTSSR